MKILLQLFGLYIAAIGGCASLIATEPVWIEEDGLLVMEAESGTPETVDTWTIRSDVDDYVGDGFIRWERGDFLSNRTHGVMRFQFIITTPGRYRLFLRSFHDPAARNKRPDEENDCWTNMQLNSTSQYYKTFRNAVLAGTDWSYRTQWVLGENDFVDAYYDIPAGQHEFRLAARAAYFMIDRIFLAKDTATIDEYAPESNRVGSLVYSDWTQANFAPAELNNPLLESVLWGFHADPDRDGLGNALEFYTGSNPLESDAQSAVQVETDGAGTTLRIRRALTANGLSLILETSEDLITWSTKPGALNEAYAEESAWWAVTVPNEDPAQYIRFVVE